MAGRSRFVVIPAELARLRGEAEVELVYYDESKFPINVYRTFERALRYAQSMVRHGPSPAWVLRAPSDLFALTDGQKAREAPDSSEIPSRSLEAGAFKRLVETADVTLLRAAEV